jgi:hypothetical protein
MARGLVTERIFSLVKFQRYQTLHWLHKAAAAYHQSFQKLLEIRKAHGTKGLQLCWF